MGGRSSRNKGKSNEYLARDYFRTLGFESHRVPSSGAAQGAKGDVTLKGHGLELRCEVKARRDEFKAIYAMYEDWCAPCMALDVEGHIVLVSLIFEDLGFGKWHRPVYANAVKPNRTINKILGMQKYLKTCDFLAIRIDRKPFLFLRYL